MLEKEYTTPALPGSFSGKSAFIRALARRGTKIKRKDVDDYLMNEETYTLHRLNRKKYKRNQVIVSGICRDVDWQSEFIICRQLCETCFAKSLSLSYFAP